MTAWNTGLTGTQFSGKDSIPPPSAPANGIVGCIEQYQVARDVAYQMKVPKVLGDGQLLDVAISGVSNPGHPNGDSVTVTVTNKNGSEGSPVVWTSQSNGSTIQ